MTIAEGDATWEIVSVDSMQVYRGMDIGTAKPTPEERARVPHYMIDVAEPTEDYDVATYQAEAVAVLGDISRRDRRGLLVGGAALYLRAVVDGLTFPGQYSDVRSELEADSDTEALHRRLIDLDPAAAGRIDPGNRRRIIRALEVTLGSGQPFSSFGPGLSEHPDTPFHLVGLRWERGALDQRIGDRFDAQMKTGFLDEVRNLRRHGMGRTASQALGYKELGEHLDGSCTLEEAVDVAKTRTRRYSRRQEKWLRRDPRIHWVDAAREHSAVVGDVVSAFDLPRP